MAAERPDPADVTYRKPGYERVSHAPREPPAGGSAVAA